MTGRSRMVPLVAKQKPSPIGHVPFIQVKEAESQATQLPESRAHSILRPVTGVDGHLVGSSDKGQRVQSPINILVPHFHCHLSVSYTWKAALLHITTGNPEELAVSPAGGPLPYPKLDEGTCGRCAKRGDFFKWRMPC